MNESNVESIDDQSPISCGQATISFVAKVLGEQDQRLSKLAASVPSNHDLARTVNSMSFLDVSKQLTDHGFCVDAIVVSEPTTRKVASILGSHPSTAVGIFIDDVGTIETGSLPHFRVLLRVDHERLLR